MGGRNLDIHATPIRLLEYRISTYASDDVISFNMDRRIFNEEMEISIPKEEIMHFLRFEMLAAESICVYIR